MMRQGKLYLSLFLSFSKLLSERRISDFWNLFVCLCICLFIYFERERQREKKRIPSRLCTISTDRAQCRARTHELWDHDQSLNEETLNWLSHPGALGICWDAGWYFEKSQGSVKSDRPRWPRSESQPCHLTAVRPRRSDKSYLSLCFLCEMRLNTISQDCHGMRHYRISNMTYDRQHVKIEHRIRPHSRLFHLATEALLKC